jgi:chitodextrinase
VAPIATGVTGAGYTDAGLSNGATFYYQVTATGPAGVSGPSNERGAIAGTPGGFDAPTPTFSFVATVPSGAAPPHVPVSIAVTASETGKAAGKRILITMQVHDEKGSLVYQKMVEHQDFSPGQSHAYAFTWTPDEEGTYTIQAGAFGDGFAPRYSWDDHAAVLVVGASGPK